MILNNKAMTQRREKKRNNWEKKRRFSYQMDQKQETPQAFFKSQKHSFDSHFVYKERDKENINNFKLKEKKLLISK